MRVQVVGPLAQRTGYGQAFHDYMMAMLEAEIDICIQPSAPPEYAIPPRYQALGDYVGFQDDLPDVFLVHATPWFAPTLSESVPKKHGMKRVCITTWETTKFSKEDARRLHETFDLVIVPAEYTANVFAEACPSLRRKLRVVPHTFDSQFWVRPAVAKDPAAPYVFYNVGVWAERKNPIGLLKAYLSEFSGSDNVVLKMVTPYVVEDDVVALARCMNLPNLPKVEFLGARDSAAGRLSDNALRDLHYQSDCYVTLARAEGWGLGAFEAAICGNPVIATDFSGLPAFLDSYPNYTPIDYQMTPCVTPEAAISKAFEIGGIKVTPMAPMAPVGIDGSQSWAEPNLLQAKDWMRCAFDKRWSRTDAAQWRKPFEYAAVGNLMKDALAELCGVGKMAGGDDGQLSTEA